jgi:hypothetical protein
MATAGIRPATIWKFLRPPRVLIDWRGQETKEHGIHEVTRPGRMRHVQATVERQERLEVGLRGTAKQVPALPADTPRESRRTGRTRRRRPSMLRGSGRGHRRRRHRREDVRVDDDPHREARTFAMARFTSPAFIPALRAALRAWRTSSSNSSMAVGEIDFKMTTSRSPTTTN